MRAVIAIGVAAFGIAHAHAASPVESLFAAYWDDTARLSPEGATFRGDYRYGDRFTDRSLEGIAAREAYWRGLQQKVRAIDRVALSPKDRVSVELLQRTADDMVLLSKYRGFQTMDVSASPFAFQGLLAVLARVAPVENVAQVEQLIARMAAYPALIDQEIASLKRGKSEGWVPTRAALGTAIAQLDAQLVSAEKSALLEPFARLGSSIPPAERDRLRERAIKTIDAHVLPATRRLRDYVAGEYLAAAPEEGGLRGYPHGGGGFAAEGPTNHAAGLPP